jgi:hypothetical protein
LLAQLVLFRVESSQGLVPLLAQPIQFSLPGGKFKRQRSGLAGHLLDLQIERPQLVLFLTLAAPGCLEVPL